MSTMESSLSVNVPRKDTEEDSSKRSSYGERHTFTVSGKEFKIDKKYKPLKKLGTGAYGVVISAKNVETEQKVAIKKVSDVFHNLLDAKRILREVRLLRHFNHRNVLAIMDMVHPAEEEELEDIYIITELMQSDLHRIIHSNNDLSLEHIQYILYQVLLGLKYMHSANVIHRDLKPSNILINEDCEVKICDFGLARGVVEEDEDLLTEYVVTRWYRAPEVICAARKYGFGIDVWSVGCILAELFLREPIFQGTSYVDQLNCIFDVLGTPNDADLECISNAKALSFIGKLKHKKPMSLKNLMPNAPESAIDLMSKMLLFDPSKRISVDDALAHPFFSEWANDDALKKSVCSENFDFSFEEMLDDSKEAVQDLLLREIYVYRPEMQFSRSLKNRKIDTAGSKRMRARSISA